MSAGTLALLIAAVLLAAVAYRAGYRRGQGEYLRRLKAAGSRFADPTFAPSTAGLEHQK